eukprot:6189576-Pleurochrysis_carterae.AAC.3
MITVVIAKPQVCSSLSLTLYSWSYNSDLLRGPYAPVKQRSSLTTLYVQRDRLNVRFRHKAVTQVISSKYVRSIEAERALHPSQSNETRLCTCSFLTAMEMNPY